MPVRVSIVEGLNFQKPLNRKSIKFNIGLCNKQNLSNINALINESKPQLVESVKPLFIQQKRNIQYEFIDLTISNKRIRETDPEEDARLQVGQTNFSCYEEKPNEIELELMVRMIQSQNENPYSVVPMIGVCEFFEFLRLPISIEKERLRRMADESISLISNDRNDNHCEQKELYCIENEFVININGICSMRKMNMELFINIQKPYESNEFRIHRMLFTDCVFECCRTLSWDFYNNTRTRMFTRDCAQLAVLLFDRFWANHEDPVSYLNPINFYIFSFCLLILATKMESDDNDEIIPWLKEDEQLSEVLSHYSKIELEVLKTLDFKLVTTTPNQWFYYYSQLHPKFATFVENMSLEDKVILYSYFDYTMYIPYFSQFRPDMISAAIFYKYYNNVADSNNFPTLRYSADEINIIAQILYKLDEMTAKADSLLKQDASIQDDKFFNCLPFIGNPENDQYTITLFAQTHEHWLNV